MSKHMEDVVMCNKEPILSFESTETLLASLGVPIASVELHLLILDAKRKKSENYEENIIDIAENGNFGATVFSSHEISVLDPHFSLKILKDFAKENGYAYISNIRLVPLRNDLINERSVGSQNNNSGGNTNLSSGTTSSFGSGTSEVRHEHTLESQISLFSTGIKLKKE